MTPFHEAIYLTGPTAVGKTLLGVSLAQRLGAEIVALDSMTLYRRMDIGTAKPTIRERGNVPHHLIKALLRGLFEGPGGDPAVREELEADAERRGDPALHDRLRAVDPRSADRLHPNDRRRVIRALEVAIATGRPLSEHQTEHDRPALGNVAVFALERSRPEVCERIDRRVEAMFAAGLVEEVRNLIAEEPPIGPVAAQGVGYREAIDLLAGRIDRGTAVERTQARTRQFAKRQATWFRGLAEVRSFPLERDEAPGATVDRLLARIEAVRSGRG